MFALQDKKLSAARLGIVMHRAMPVAITVTIVVTIWNVVVHNVHTYPS